MVDSKLLLDAVCSLPVRYGHYTAVVNQNINYLLIGIDLGGSLTNLFLGVKIELQDPNLDTWYIRFDGDLGLLYFLGVAAGEDEELWFVLCDDLDEGCA